MCVFTAMRTPLPTCLWLLLRLHSQQNTSAFLTDHSSQSDVLLFRSVWYQWSFFLTIDCEFFYIVVIPTGRGRIASIVVEGVAGYSDAIQPDHATLTSANITINQLSASAPSRRHHTYTPVSRYGQQAGCTIDSFAGAQAFHRTVSHPHTIVRARWMKQKHGSKVVSSFCCR